MVFKNCNLREFISWGSVFGVFSGEESVFGSLCMQKREDSAFLGIKMNPGRSGCNWSALNTSVSDPQDSFRPTEVVWDASEHRPCVV